MFNISHTMHNQYNSGAIKELPPHEGAEALNIERTLYYQKLRPRRRPTMPQLRLPQSLLYLLAS